MPAGRPTKYEPEMCEKILDLAKKGASKAEMALEIGIAMSTFDVWQNENDQFSEAVKDAEKISQGWWEREGRKATFGGVPGFNATSYIFNMKNRFKEDWRDKQEMEHQGGVKVVTLQSDDERL